MAELDPHGAYLDTCDIGIPHSIVFVYVSNEIEIGMVFGAIFEIQV